MQACEPFPLSAEHVLNFSRSAWQHHRERRFHRTVRDRDQRPRSPRAGRSPRLGLGRHRKVSSHRAMPERSPYMLTSVLSNPSAGQIVGMWIGPVITDKLGRKVGMMSLAGVLLIASLARWLSPLLDPD